jgi:hypothetical protein
VFHYPFGEPAFGEYFSIYVQYILAYSPPPSRLFGGYRNGRGPYQVVLDGQITNCGGFDGDDAVNASALLFGQGNLNSSHEHTVQFKNVGSGSPPVGVIDLDYVELDYPSSLMWQLIVVW